MNSILNPLEENVGTQVVPSQVLIVDSVMYLVRQNKPKILNLGISSDRYLLRKFRQYCIGIGCSNLLQIHLKSPGGSVDKILHMFA